MKFCDDKDDLERERMKILVGVLRKFSHVENFKKPFQIFCMR